MAWHHSAINMQVMASFHRVRQTTAVVLVCDSLISAYQTSGYVSHNWLHDVELAKYSLDLAVMTQSHQPQQCSSHN